MNIRTVVVASFASVAISAAAAIAQGEPGGRAGAVSSAWRMPQADAPLEDNGSFYETYVGGRLHIGVSYTSLSMKETSTPHERAYLGNLDTLREKDTDALGLTIKYDFCEYLAIMFAYDMHAELSAWNCGYKSTDGSLKLNGYTVQAIGQYPWEVVDGKASLIPYVGLGASDISASWSHANWWHLGWQSPEDYDKLSDGSTRPRNGYSRWMLPDDPSLAFTYSLGLVIQLYSHLDIDVFYRVVDLEDIETKFRTGSPKGHVLREGAFPAKFSALGVALRYVF